MPRSNSIGTISLIIAVAGAVTSHALALSGTLADSTWLRIVTAGFEAALVGGLADWFAVTALFRHPLGIPIPHTAIIPSRRAKIIESIVSMVQEEWLSPEVIRGRLMRFSPSEFVRNWLCDPEHVERLGAPARDVLRTLAGVISEPEMASFAERALQNQLRELPLDATAGRWLLRFSESESAFAAFESIARSLARFAQRPDTADRIRRWLERSARKLREEGKILVPLFLRSKAVQRAIVEATCDYANTELLQASQDPQHPLRQAVFTNLRRFAEHLAAGNAETIAQIENFRTALVDSLESGAVVRDLLGNLRRQIEGDLARPNSELATLVNRQLRSGILEWLEDSTHRHNFDDWVRRTAGDLIERHHDQIGLTVKENLEALETRSLVAQIEERVGADLQFIRLNGAVVGGFIGMLLAVTHWAVGR